MRIKIGLLVFADRHILLKKRDDYCYEIPQSPLPEDRDGISIACRILSQCSGITAKWMDLLPMPGHVFDGVDRNPEFREVFITYNLYIPAQLLVGKEYEWVQISDLSVKKFHLDNAHIIRYSILGGNNVFS